MFGYLLIGHWDFSKAQALLIWDLVLGIWDLLIDLFLFNTLTHKKELFKPINPGKIGLYTCGPTVYDYQQIGNWRTFVFEDILRRVLEYNGFEVVQVMNATDVGHLTGDNIGKADLGEDRMEKAAKRERKTAWEIADFYIKDFLESQKKLNIEPPTIFARATDHIEEQIELMRKLENRGLIYRTTMGVYFDTAKFPDYGRLGGQKMIDKRAMTRGELKEDHGKKSQSDFALWKFSSLKDKRQMEWDSPWGRGFPGWHLECSAMAMKYLGESFDIHTGGVDHIAIHHTNEIAQSEGATGKPFVKYWLHGEFLTVDGGRMGKSLGNAYTLQDVLRKGFEPLALRFLYFSAHYRSKLNFSWEALESTQKALEKLRIKARGLKENKKSLGQEFLAAINDDLNMPQALAITWQTENRNDLRNFDKVLALDLFKRADIQRSLIPDRVKELFSQRQTARRMGNFDTSDQLREEIQNLGFGIEDNQSGSRLFRLRLDKKS